MVAMKRGSTCDLGSAASIKLEKAIIERQMTITKRSPIGKLQLIILEASLPKVTKKYFGTRGVHMAIEDCNGEECAQVESTQEEDGVFSFKDNTQDLPIFDFTDTIVLTFSSTSLRKTLLGNIIISISEVIKNGFPVSSYPLFVPREPLLSKVFFLQGTYTILLEEKHENLSIARDVRKSSGTCNLHLKLSLHSPLGTTFFTTPVRNRFIQPWAKVEEFRFEDLNSFMRRVTSHCIMPRLIQMVYRSPWKRWIFLVIFIAWFLICYYNAIYLLPWLFVSFVMINGSYSYKVEENRLKNLQSEYVPSRDLGYMESYKNYTVIRDELGPPLNQRLGALAETLEKIQFLFSYGNSALTVLANVVLLSWAVGITIAIHCIHRKWWMFSFGLVLAYLANRFIPKASSPVIEDPLERFSSGIAKTKKMFSVDSLKRSPPELRSKTFFIKRFLFNFWDHIPTQEWRDTFHVHGSQLISENNKYRRWENFQNAFKRTTCQVMGWDEAESARIGKKLKIGVSKGVRMGKALSLKIGSRVKAFKDVKGEKTSKRSLWGERKAESDSSDEWATSS